MKKINKNFHRFFTLIEVILVLSIVMIVTAISFAYVARTPSGLFLSSTSAQIEELMMSAQNQASLRGTQRNVVYNSEKKILYISDPVANPDEVNIDMIESDTPNSSQGKFSLPESVKIEFPNFNEDKIEYRFFPDGSASGPQMYIITKGKTMSLNVSQLTGIVILNEIETE